MDLEKHNFVYDCTVKLKIFHIAHWKAEFQTTNQFCCNPSVISLDIIIRKLNAQKWNEMDSLKNGEEKKPIPTR